MTKIERITLDPIDFEQLEKLLKDPPEANDKLKQALKEYNEKYQEELNAALKELEQK